MVRQEWGRMWVDGEGWGFRHSDGAELTAHMADPRSRLARRPAEQRFVPSFMALFVSPPDRRVAGET